MSKKILIGAHTSASGGSFNALYEGKEIGATTIQLFTSNQKQWHGREISTQELLLWQKAKDETGIEKIMSHDSYLINLGSPDPSILDKSRKAFEAELQRCHLLEISFLNFHPGAATKSSEEACLDTIVESLLSLEKQINQGSTRLLLETTAGQGTCVGYKFEHLQYIIEQTKHTIPIGVCIDTCHIFAAGYDIRTFDAWEETLNQFNKTVGLKNLYAFHINDSMKGLGSRVDRHANIGEGEIGKTCFEYLMTDPKTKDLPKYLETPDGPALWKTEITMLKKFAEK